MSIASEDSGPVIQPDEVDARFTRAVTRAADRAAPEPQDTSFLERRLEDALVKELAMEFSDGDVVARKKLSGITLPDWNPLPGSVLRREELVVAAELKLDDVDQTLGHLQDGERESHALGFGSLRRGGRAREDLVAAA